MDIWTEKETIIAFNVYCKVPFANSSKHHPLIVKYARMLGRTPDALNMKIGNIGRLDPSLKAQGISGLSHGAKMEETVWRKFAEDPAGLAYESERLIAEYSRQRIEDVADIDTKDLPVGEERTAEVRRRVHQSFFRAAVMSAYHACCCISGVAAPGLAEACHIVDWARHEDYRTNPSNGLCLNPFFHSAYDAHLVAITPDGTVAVSDRLLASTEEGRFKTYLMHLEGSAIRQPDRFLPRRDLLALHYEAYKKENAVSGTGGAQ